MAHVQEHIPPSPRAAGAPAVMLGIVGGIVASSSLYVPVLIGTWEPICATSHCFAITTEVSLFSAWDVWRTVTTQESHPPLSTHVIIYHIIYFPAVILAPAVIAVVLLGLSIWTRLAPGWRWIHLLRLVLASAGLLLLLLEDCIAAATYSSFPFLPQFLWPHTPSVVSIAVALEVMYGGHGVLLVSAVLGLRRGRG